MQDRIFGDREKALEESYFRQEDAKLLKKLHEKAQLDEIALALGEKLQVDNPDLLMRVRKAGVSLETAPALFVAPLVQVAWASGSVSKDEHQAVLRLARGRGVEPGSAAYVQLEEWLAHRPDDALFDTAVEVIKYGFSVLPPAEREQRIATVVEACNQVAKASGSSLWFVLGLKDVMGIKNVDESEAAMLDLIATRLRRPI
jgi:hypothetical protein